MYESFFGLNEKPFSLLPDPGFFYLSKIHREALTLVEYGLHNQAGFTVLTGEIGSGKTTLMRYLLEKLGDDLAIGLISHTHQSLGQIMDWVCVAFDLEVPAGDKIRQHQAFVDFLLEQYSQGRKTLLIIDEAQNLGLDKLEEIRLLSNINADKDLVLQLLLLGQPQLRDQLRSPDLEQFVQRISASYHLGRLSAEETYYYIRHRLKVAGGRKDIFAADACHAVYHYSQGIPRIINLICETALVFAYGSGEKTVTAKAIDEFVKSDAPHLLMAIDPEKRQPLPEYTPIVVADDEEDEEDDEPALSATSADRVGLDEGEATEGPGQASGDPGGAESPRAVSPLQAQTQGRSAPDPKGQRRLYRANRGAADPSPGSAIPLPRADEEEELSLDALMKPSGSGQRWTKEIGAIAAGVLLGVAIVAWYLNQGSPGEPSLATAAQPGPSTADAGARPTPAAPSEGPAPETPQTPPDLLAGQDGPAETQDEPLATTTDRDDESARDEIAPAAAAPAAETAVTTDGVEPPASLTATATDEQPSEQLSEVAPSSLELQAAQGSDASQGSANSQVGALDRLETELQGLPLSLTRVDSKTLKADFSKIIRFKAGAVTLDADAQNALRQFARLLKRSDGIALRVVAHTDSMGSRSNNLALSEKRAQNVADYLKQLGIDQARIQHEGHGEDDLKVDVEHEKKVGPWVNRRVEVDLIERG